jgi:transposase InsO family protein
MLNILDEYTKECLDVTVDGKITSYQLIERLMRLFIVKGDWGIIRSDNGPEFTAKAVREWLADLRVQTLFIEPRSPMESGYIELFNGRLSDKLLSGEIFMASFGSKGAHRG